MRDLGIQRDPGPGGETPPLPAATVIVLHDGAQGLETLLLRRDARGAFGGMWVFPGGRVDAIDADPSAPGDELAAARRAASREALEEAGLSLDPTSFVAFSHWLPPASAPKRFATWFFVARSTAGEVAVDGGEIHEHAWLHPAAALARQQEGVLQLAPPTWVTLHELASFGSVDAVMSEARQREPERYSTRPIDVDGLPVLTWHGDAAYESGSDGPGPRHRLWMAEGGWRYERTT
jgi:8-oxo-dGTP pyrophosphatase MutT (NUDIX family)